MTSAANNKILTQRLSQPLVRAIAHYRQQCPHWQELTQAVDLAAITDMADLHRLPIIAKDDFPQAQELHPPFGNLRCFGTGQPWHLYRSPGPIYEFDTYCDNFWQLQTALEAAGFDRQDRIANAFSYHYTPAGMMFDEGARRLGCQVLPAGPGNSEQLLAAIAHLQITAYVGTPDFLKIILDKAQEMGTDIKSLNKALVTGGYLSPAIRQQCQDKGISVYQCYATADVGLIAYEKANTDGLVCADNIWVEIVNPQTLQPVADGETGEVVVSRLVADAPLLRFATGDLSAIVSSPEQASLQLKGWLGRSDAAVKVKGLFIRPVQLQNLLAQFESITDAQLQIDSDNHLDRICLKVCAPGADAELLSQVQSRFKAITGLTTDVEATSSSFAALIADKRVVE